MKKQHVALLALLALATTPAFASGGGIPQIDQTDSYAGQAVWLAISFVLLYLMVANIIAPRISSVLDQRARAIDEAIAAAEELKAKASATRGDFESASANAKAQAAAAIASAQAEASKNAAEATAALSQKLDAQAKAAQDSIAKALNKAHHEVDDAAVNLADVMAAKLLAGNTSAQAKPTKKAS